MTKKTIVLLAGLFVLIAAFIYISFNSICGSASWIPVHTTCADARRGAGAGRIDALKVHS
jgi:hypothetical protein